MFGRSFLNNRTVTVGDDTYMINGTEEIIINGGPYQSRFKGIDVKKCVDLLDNEDTREDLLTLAHSASQDAIKRYEFLEAINNMHEVSYSGLESKNTKEIMNKYKNQVKIYRELNNEFDSDSTENGKALR